MKYKLKIVSAQTLFMLLYWLLSNYKYLPQGEKISDFQVLTNNLMNPYAGYNSEFFSLGYIMTLLFSFSFFMNFKIVDSSLIVKHGRDRFVLNEFKNGIVHTLWFALGYCGVNTIMIVILCDIQMLIDSKFFVCSLLYFVSMFMYFLVLSAVMQLFRITFGFNRFYLVASAVLFFAVNSLPYMMLDKGLIFFSSFIFDWFQSGAFDTFEYMRYFVVCALIAAICITAARFIFIKKDIMFNEEED